MIRKQIGQMTPAEVDDVLAGLWRRESLLRLTLDCMNESLKFYKADSHTRTRIERDIEDVKAKLQTVRGEAEPFEDEYRRRPWKRYFLVTNGNGHVHRERHCSTCFPTTEFAWLPELSGCDEAAMVEDFGEKACSVCFPDAPSMYAAMKAAGRTPRREQEVNARRAEREAKRAAAAAKKAANAITNPDGTPLRVMRERETIRTVRAAREELLHAVSVTMRDIPNLEHKAECREAVEIIALALAAKTGATVEAIKAEAEAKVRKRGY